ncbi:hypothetical protein DXA30_06120 [Fusobacterium ulcerans]|uniref:hypothetical protein n=1 Tax=Fusobacterium ulcerans TaxID=861 RepID=UPI000E542EA2|nr:hypothetical protein [Fusobacterium ulcerans]RGY65070.1 hypothetical protein DXA30_06120 [Fusobacterium ulcerans]
MKSKTLNILILIIFFGFEILNFKYNYTSNTYTDLRSSFWLVHLLISFVYIVLFNYIFKIDIGYYDVFIIFFPGLGFFIMILGGFFDIKKDIENHIEEAYSMEMYKKEKQEEDYINFYLDINTVGAYDSLLVKNSEEKKKFLFGFNPPKISFKVEILQKALLDDDIDVIHYAAAELNKIDVRLQENIKNAEKEKNLYKIYDAYREYIDSGLLFESILKFYQNKTLSLLLQLVEKDKRKEYELLKLYRKIGEKNKYEILLKKLLNKNASLGLVKKLIQFLYEENRYKEMLDIHQKYKNYDIKLPALFNTFE